MDAVIRVYTFKDGLLSKLAHDLALNLGLFEIEARGEAIHALMFERICDALADGDFKSLGCSVEAAQATFRSMMRAYLVDGGPA